MVRWEPASRDGWRAHAWPPARRAAGPHSRRLVSHRFWPRKRARQSSWDSGSHRRGHCLPLLRPAQRSAQTQGGCTDQSRFLPKVWVGPSQCARDPPAHPAKSAGSTFPPATQGGPPEDGQFLPLRLRVGRAARKPRRDAFWWSASSSAPRHCCMFGANARLNELRVGLLTIPRILGRHAPNS